MSVEGRRSTLPDWPRLMSIEFAAAYVSLSENTVREHGPKPKHHGRRVLYDRIDLDRWADSLDGQPLDAKGIRDEANEEERRFFEARNG